MAKKTTDKREGWLRDLKVGDEVGVSASTYERRLWLRLDKVIEVTSGGTIRTAKGYEFRPDGRTRKGSAWDNSDDLVQVTEEFKAQVRRQNLEGWVRKYIRDDVLDEEKLKALSDTELRGLLDAMKVVLKDLTKG